MTAYEIAATLWQTDENKALEVAKFIGLMKESDELTEQINTLEQELEDLQFELAIKGMKWK